MSVALVAILAGCSSAPNTPPPGTSTTASSGEATQGPDRFSAVDPSEFVDTLDDTFGKTAVMVDSDGRPELNKLDQFEADSQDSPAPIAADGTIYIRYVFSGGQLSRELNDAYISVDANGETRGIDLECEPTPHAVPQNFICSAQFKDAQYENGVYYGVLVTHPSSPENYDYGVKTTIGAAYTKLP